MHLIEIDDYEHKKIRKKYWYPEVYLYHDGTIWRYKDGSPRDITESEKQDNDWGVYSESLPSDIYLVEYFIDDDGPMHNAFSTKENANKWIKETEKHDSIRVTPGVFSLTIDDFSIPEDDFSL